MIKSLLFSAFLVPILTDFFWITLFLDFILHNLHSGATIYEAVGAYNMEKRNEIITIVDKGEYQKLMDYMNHKDPEAFITVYTVSDLRYRPKV